MRTLGEVHDISALLHDPVHLHVALRLPILVYPWVHERLQTVPIWGMEELSQVILEGWILDRLGQELKVVIIRIGAEEIEAINKATHMAAQITRRKVLVL